MPLAFCYQGPDGDKECEISIPLVIPFMSSKVLQVTYNPNTNLATEQPKSVHTIKSDHV